jgi:putative ABC transport system ATP-binding protein
VRKLFPGAACDPPGPLRHAPGGLIMLRMESVSKQYRHRKGGVMALNEVNLTIEQGDFVSVVGPSGSGKSTLLLMLGGMLSPTAGRVYLGDKSLYDLTPDQRAAVRRAQVGFVFQTFNLVPYLTALENVQVPLLLAGKSEADQKRKATELLSRLGLGERLDHKPSELSVGQQQRVALARVLANDPVLILADEPTGNLDPETGQQIISFLEEINQEGRTIVMVTHDMRAAAKAKRTLRLKEGSIAA